MIAIEKVKNNENKTFFDLEIVLFKDVLTKNIEKLDVLEYLKK